MDNTNKSDVLNNELYMLIKVINDIGGNYIECEDDMVNELFYTSLSKMKEACKNIEYAIKNNKEL